MINLYSIIVGLFTISGAITAILSWRSIKKQKMTSLWQAIEATIIESSSSSKDNNLMPLVKFDYEVNDINYQGNVELPLGEANAPGFGERFTKQYPIGSKITIYCSPENPEINTLQPGVNKESWLMLTIGTVSFLVGLTFFLLYI